MKLILVTDYMLSNDYNIPDKNLIRNYGHDLFNLFNGCGAIAGRYDENSFNFLAVGVVELRLLKLLSNFAKRARYYNLDALNKVGADYKDPVEEWGGLIYEIAKSDMSKRSKRCFDRDVENAKIIAALTERMVFTLQFGMNRKAMTYEDFLLEASLCKKVAPYAIVRIFNILKPLLELLGCVGRKGLYEAPRDRGVLVPDFSEFFCHFGGTAAEIRNKRRW